MQVLAKHPIKIGKVLVPKGSQGTILQVTNSLRILESFPNLKHKPDGWYYIVKFPEVDECICSRDQLVFHSE